MVRVLARMGLTLSVAAVVVIADQLTKGWVVSHFLLHQSRDVVGDFIRFTFVLNPNAVLGIPIPSVHVYYAFAFFAVGLLLYLAVRESQRRYLFLYGMILGGAVGNLVDRLRIGAVVDFIDVGIGRWRWPVFNLADSAITLALLGLVWLASRTPAGVHPVEEFPPAEGEPETEHA